MVYLVVEFIQEEKPEVIPSSWFNEQDCIAKWPNIRSQIAFRSLLVLKALPKPDWAEYAKLAYKSGKLYFVPVLQIKQLPNCLFFDDCMQC